MRKGIALLLVLAFLTASFVIAAKPVSAAAPVENSWVSKAPMHVARSDLRVAVVNGKIYAIGGNTQNGVVGVNEVYDPATDSWTTEAPMPTAAAVASGVFNNKIYFAGGFFDANYVASSLTQIYDPNTDMWSQGSPSPTFFLSGSAGVTTGVMAPKRIYVFDSPYGDIMAMPNDPMYTNQVYDPEEDSWVAGAGIPTRRSGFAAAIVNDMLYVIGGFTQVYSDFPDDWMYGPSVTLYATNEQYTPFGYGTIPPAVHVVSPENQTYASGNASLALTVNKPALWLGYSLDGQDNVTITGNTTLGGLSNGLHNVTVYAKDEFENVGASETITFNVQEPFPAVPVAAASVATVAVVGVGLLVYFRKRNH